MSPLVPEVAETIFGDRLGLAVEYAALLETEGVLRGLIGPREAPRLWDRHLLNCAVVGELISEGATVIDVGSGAGLPGIVLAVARPDISVILVEPLARRTAFLESALAALGLEEQVTVVRGRAEEQAGRLHAPVVTARAVAPLDRLGRWCLPLADIGGRMLALKGASAGTEIDEHQAVLRRLGGGQATIRLCGAGLIEPPTTVVEVVRERAAQGVERKPPRSRSGSKSGSGSGSGGERSGSGSGSGRSLSGSDSGRSTFESGRRSDLDSSANSRTGSGRAAGSGGRSSSRSDSDSGQRAESEEGSRSGNQPGPAGRSGSASRSSGLTARSSSGGQGSVGGRQGADGGGQRSTGGSQSASGSDRAGGSRRGQKPAGPEWNIGRGRRQA